MCDFSSFHEAIFKILFFVVVIDKSYPFIDSYSDDFFLWCYIHLSHGGYCTAIVFIGIDSMFLTTCFHLSAQFRILTMDMDELFNDMCKTKYLTPGENAIMNQRLKEFVIRQTRLIKICRHFIRIFTAAILVHFISVAVIIGIGSILFITV